MGQVTFRRRSYLRRFLSLTLVDMKLVLTADGGQLKDEETQIQQASENTCCDNKTRYQLGGRAGDQLKTVSRNLELVPRDGDGDMMHYIVNSHLFNLVGKESFLFYCFNLTLSFENIDISSANDQG